MRTRSLGIVAMALALGWAVWAGVPEVALGPKEFALLVNPDAKFIQDTLAKDIPDKKTARKVKIAALMIAHYAQSGMTKDNAKAMATLRDKALQIIKVVDEKPAEAKTLAAALSAKPKAEGNPKTEKIPLHTHLDLELVMRNFSSKEIGGFGLEKELDALIDFKGPLTAEQQQKILLLAGKIVMIANLAQEYIPEKDEPKGKTRKNWQIFASGLRDTATGLVEAARKKGDVAETATAVSLSCVKCHDVFKKD